MLWDYDPHPQMFAGISYTLSRSGRPAIFTRDPDANALEFTQVDWSPTQSFISYCNSTYIAIIMVYSMILWIFVWHLCSCINQVQILMKCDLVINDLHQLLTFSVEFLAFYKIQYLIFLIFRVNINFIIYCKNINNIIHIKTETKSMQSIIR